MALIKHRPRLSLRAPRGVPGRDFVVTLIVDAEHEVPTSALHVDLIGRERTATPEYEETRELLHLTAHLRPPRLVPPGRHHYDCRFTLPAGLPPSYDGRTLEVHYMVEARVVIPWWPDAQGAWTVPVDTPPAHATPPGPAQAHSVPRTPGRDDPLLEVSLGASVVAAGDSLTGEIALTNVPARWQRGFDVQLVSVERRPIEADHRVEAQRFAFPALTARSEDGQPVPFEITLPRALTPSFTSKLGGLYWFIEVLAKSASRSLTARLPVTVVRPEAAAVMRARVAAPVIGSQHLRSLWDTVATRAGLSHHDGRLSGAVAGAELSITRERRGSRRYLVGELAFAPLRLGLRAELRRGLFTRARGLRPDDEGDDRGYDIDARDPRQAGFLLRALAEALRALPEASLGDDHARFLLGDAGRHEDRLLEFVQALGSFARELDAVRASIPPPAALAGAVDRWRELGGTLEGWLESADMSIDGSLRGVAVAVRADWGEGGVQAPALVLEARPAQELDARWHTVRVPAEAAELPPGGAALLARALGGESDAALAVDAHGVELHLPEVPADVRPLFSRLDALVELALLMRVGAVPYR